MLKACLLGWAPRLPSPSSSTGYHEIVCPPPQSSERQQVCIRCHLGSTCSRDVGLPLVHEQSLAYLFYIYFAYASLS